MFSSLILISLVATPLIMIFQLIPSLGAAIGCAKRIGEFLQRDEWVDCRTVGSSTTSTGSPTVPSTTAPEISPEGFSKCSSTSVNSIITFRDVDLTIEERPLLHNINLSIPRGKHVIITGPVGCGKSLLLQAILGEIPVHTGVVTVASGTCRVNVGYCAQTAWVENASVEENVFRTAGDDPVWRERVADACAIRELLERDEGETIGSGGARISGGERQRLVSSCSGGI